MNAARTTLKTQPMMLATQMVRGIHSDDLGAAHGLAKGSTQETLEGLTALALLLAQRLATSEGTTVDQVLDRVQDDSLTVIRAAGEVG